MGQVTTLRTVIHNVESAETKASDVNNHILRFIAEAADKNKNIALVNVDTLLAISDEMSEVIKVLSLAEKCLDEIDFHRQEDKITDIS